MSLFQKNDGVGSEAAEASSEWTITTPSEGPDNGVVSEGADVGGISFGGDAVSRSGMSARQRTLRRGLGSSPAIMFAPTAQRYVHEFGARPERWRE